MTHIHSDASRRAFLQRLSQLSLAGAAAPWALNLAAIGEAAASTAADYRALVCVFLYGGNDYGNTLIPYDNAHYAQYQAQRPTLAYAQSALTATALTPLAAPVDRNGDSYQYALAPELAPLLPLFHSGRLATLLNIGTLMQPTDKTQYTNRSVPLPPKLFSHNDQQSFWQSSSPEGATSGWGGRIGDLLMAGNGNATFTCVSVSGNAVFMSGRTAVQYQVTSNGSVALNALKNPLFGSSACSDALRSLIVAPRAHLFEAEHTRVVKRALEANDALTAALAGAPTINTAFPSGNALGDQLKMVARMISVADALSAKRQVFFVSLNGFDTHDGLLSVHPGLLSTVADALAAFQAALAELNVEPQVTTFTASDFGRTLAGNNDGSDHGWGSMHFVLGGAVRGQRFYGTAPVIGNNGVDDVGQGRLLPTLAVDQLAATLGRWFGVGDSDLLTVLPNLHNWNPSGRDLGLLA
ncbi:MAG TPA: DUF1501 domain-containing protein [Burkholderiaceae bacterium]|nr:DUF1501 domain-containing protein [Burkholderiaceae bacterium]HSC01094.1 DUF1501 domain-containing protein [Burkholderiaceae bacterium]